MNTAMANLSQSTKMLNLIMGITVLKILNKTEEYAVAELMYGSEKLVAQVCDADGKLKDKIGKKNLDIELDYDQLVSVKLIEDFNDADSLIRQQESNYIVKASVHSIMKIEDDSLIDLYIQTGVNFLAIQQSEIGDLELKEEQGIEVELTQLRFFPTGI
jgi:hypothetical protein